MSVCSIEGCGRTLHGRGLCQMHYRRWARSNPPDLPHRFSAAEERLWSHVAITVDGCWLSDLGITPQGYSRFQVGGRDGKWFATHRYVYELAYGPIPPGLVLDHLCRNKACVRPDHLEAVTNKVNTLRGIGPSALNVQKTHCPQGHPYSGPNLYLTSVGSRQCVTCRRVRALIVDGVAQQDRDNGWRALAEGDAQR